MQRKLLCILHGLLPWSRPNGLQDRKEYATLGPAVTEVRPDGDDLRHCDGEMDCMDHSFRVTEERCWAEAWLLSSVEWVVTLVCTLVLE